MADTDTKDPVYVTEALIAEDIDAYLEQHQHKTMLRFITCGSVDDGKSTLIGRLLYDSKMIFEDQLAALESDSKRVGTQGQEIDFALLVDGLAAEREQGITIDVAYRFFNTQKRKIDILPLRADPLRVSFQRGQLILEDHLRIVEEPPDQRGLAVVDRAAGDEAQQALMLMPVEISVDILGDQRVGLVGIAHLSPSLSREGFGVGASISEPPSAAERWLRRRLPAEIAPTP